MRSLAGGYTLAVIHRSARLAFLVVGFLLIVSVLQAQSLEALHVSVAEGRSESFDSWLGANGPAVLMVWATWAPRADTALERLARIRRACEERDIALVLVDVQEPYEVGREALRQYGLPWIHDRHGQLLKHFRIIKIPRLLLVGAGGELISQADVSEDAVRSWEER